MNKTEKIIHLATLANTLAVTISSISTEPSTKETEEGINHEALNSLFNKVVSDLNDAYRTSDSQQVINFEEEITDAKVIDSEEPAVNNDKDLDHTEEEEHVNRMGNKAEEVQKAKDKVKNAPKASEVIKPKAASPEEEKESPGINVIAIMNKIKAALSKNKKGSIDLNDSIAIKNYIKEEAAKINSKHDLIEKDRDLNQFFGYLADEARAELKKEKLNTTKEPQAPIKEENSVEAIINEVEAPAEKVVKEQTKVVPTPKPVEKEAIDTDDKDPEVEETSVESIIEAVESNIPVEKSSTPVAEEKTPVAEEGSITLEGATKALEACKNYEEITSTMGKIYTDLFLRKQNITIEGENIAFFKWARKTLIKIKGDTADASGKSKIIPKSNSVLKAEIHRWQTAWGKA